VCTSLLNTALYLQIYETEWNDQLHKIKVGNNFYLCPGADPIKLVFFANEEFLPFFADKLDHFIINDFFLYVTNTKAQQPRSWNKEKKVL